MKLFSTTRPLKSKLEEAMKTIEKLENQIKADTVEIDRIKHVRFLIFKYYFGILFYRFDRFET
jgi:hypothetical protein